MGEQDLSRRQILTGVVAAGGAGALGGRGTTALLSDRETFTNNSIQASASTAGTVELDVGVSEVSDPVGVEFSVDLPGGNNNPSYIWVQSKDCPDGNLKNIEVKLRVECGATSNTIPTESLLDAINKLRKGVQLHCSTDERCFDPGDSVDLILEVTDVKVTDVTSESNFANDEQEFGNNNSNPDNEQEFGNNNSNPDNEQEFGNNNSNPDKIELNFEFFAEQCRYNDSTTRPFDEKPPCSGGEEGNGGGQGISFIAFCSNSGNDLSANITNINSTTDDGQPNSVEWEATTHVDYVTVKSGSRSPFTVYDYTDESKESGTAKTGEDENAIYQGDANNSMSSSPCELAADIVNNRTINDNGNFSGESIKLEDDENEIKV